MSTGKSAPVLWPRFSGSVLAFFLILALICDVSTAALSAPPANAASPAPGIAFDEIARVIKADATPPPVGTFDADAAAIAALPPLSLPTRPSGGGVGNALAMGALGLIPMVGGFIEGAVMRAHIAAERAANKKIQEEYAATMTAHLKAGVLASFAFYRGWSRVALTPEFTAIEKPDQGLSLSLNYLTKTYQTFQNATNVETYTAQSGKPTVPQPTLEGAPGVTLLAPVTIAGRSARGYRTTGSINVPQITSSCSAGKHQIVETEYVSDLTDPQYNPSLRLANTQPLVTACTEPSSASHIDPGRLVLYRVVTIDEGTSTAYSVALERGNIRSISEQDAELFQPPADFKETQ